MKVYKINIKNILIGIISCSFLCAEIGLLGGISYGGVTYNEEISEHISITNGIGFNAGLEKSIGSILIGTGYLLQSYTEDFNSRDYNSTFKNTVTASYLIGYLIYPYEVWKFRFWGGLQFGQCLSGNMTKTENEIEQKTNMSSNDYNLDFGLLIGTDIMLTQHIGSRLSYYYGLAKVLSEDVLLSIDESNLNVINVGVNAQLLIRLNPSN